jgi:inner membrane protein involved in colicin E2 resistance
MNTESNTPIPDPSGTPQRAPSDLRRHLLFGLALALAFGSMYAGIFGLGRLIQYSLAVGALIIVVIALASRANASRRG